MRGIFKILCSFSLITGVYSHGGHEKEVPSVNTDTLKEWIGSQSKPMLIDARENIQENHKRLPGSIQLSYNAPDSEIQKKLPSKTQRIVIYCETSRCPMSTWMTERLHDMGYESVYKYSDGLIGWMRVGNTVESY